MLLPTPPPPRLSVCSVSVFGLVGLYSFWSRRPHECARALARMCVCVRVYIWVVCSASGVPGRTFIGKSHWIVLLCMRGLFFICSRLCWTFATCDCIDYMYSTWWPRRAHNFWFRLGRRTTTMQIVSATRFDKTSVLQVGPVRTRCAQKISLGRAPSSFGASLPPGIIRLPPHFSFCLSWKVQSNANEMSERETTIWNIEQNGIYVLFNWCIITIGL